MSDGCVSFVSRSVMVQCNASGRADWAWEDVSLRLVERKSGRCIIIIQYREGFRLLGTRSVVGNSAEIVACDNPYHLSIPSQSTGPPHLLEIRTKTHSSIYNPYLNIILQVLTPMLSIAASPAPNKIRAKRPCDHLPIICICISQPYP